MAFITLRQARVLKSSGWTRVDLDPETRYEPADAWLRMTDVRYHNFGWQYWFKRSEDAVMFTLKWA